MQMIKLSELDGYIRSMVSADLEQVLTWRNHPDIRRNMLSNDEISLAEHVRWFDRVSIDPARQLFIFEQNGESLGFVQFEEVGSYNVSNWGFYAAPDAPKGTGRKLGNAALNYAFSTLGLHKVCGQALAFNEPSIRFHLKLGFQQEGVLREHHRNCDSYYDLLCFGLLDREWTAVI
jgi:UDP-4-amino-4,6-dideoxy-N-acetyl-beta-L-altrosamine N-acetyltransferase